MTDKQIYAALIEVLKLGFQARTLNHVVVLRGYQPHAQGRLSAPNIQLVKLFDTRIGQPFKTNLYRPDSQDFLHREIQQMESTFQVMAFMQENAKDEQSLTASDLCNVAANILAHDDTLFALGKQGLHPARFSPIRAPQFENEKGVYEANPSFDLVLTHRFITESVAPAAQTLEGKFA